MTRIPAAAEQVGDVLGTLGGNGDDSEEDRLLAHDPLELADRPDDEVSDSRSHLARIAVEERRHHEAARPQAVVLRDGRAQIARADDRDPLHVVRAEDVLDAIAEQLDVVADAPLAELPEVREVSANLRGVDLGHLGEPRRGDRLSALFAQVEQCVEVGRQALDDALRNPHFDEPFDTDKGPRIVAGRREIS